MAKTYKGKSTRLGGGGRFKEGVDKIMSKGTSKKEAEAIMANAGRKKYGAKKMAEMSATGRKRAARKK